MIQKIQDFIQDNTTIDITRNQIMLGLGVISSILILVVVFIFQSATGPQKESASVQVSPPDRSAPMHTSGQ